MLIISHYFVYCPLQEIVHLLHAPTPINLDHFPLLLICGNDRHCFFDERIHAAADDFFICIVRSSFRFRTTEDALYPLFGIESQVNTTKVSVCFFHDPIEVTHLVEVAWNAIEKNALRRGPRANCLLYDAHDDLMWNEFAHINERLHGTPQFQSAGRNLAELSARFENIETECGGKFLRLRPFS